MNRFDGRVALISAAASGLGEAGARRLASEGAHVVIWDRDTAALEKAAARAKSDGLSISTDAVDMYDRAAIEAAVGRIIAGHGRIDVLVNNIGGSFAVPFRFMDQTDDDWDKVITLNINSVVWTTRAVIPHMRKAGYGRIINMGSKAGRFGSLFAGAPYSAAKGAMSSFTLQLAQEYGPEGITCNTICPGAILTERVDKFLDERHSPQERQRIVDSIPVRRQGRVEDIAAAVAYLASEEAGFVTGASLDVNGGQGMSI